MIIIIFILVDTPQIGNTYTEQVDNLQNHGTYVPPNKPPPILDSHVSMTQSNHHYSRLIRSQKKAGKYRERPVSDGSVNSSIYYNNTPEYDNYDDDGIEYYAEFNEEHMENPYVNENESLVYTDAQYGAESDFYLQKQRKKQSFVRSSSLELESDKEGARAREAANMMNATGTLSVVNSPRHVYQNCVPKSEYDNARLKPTIKTVNRATGSTSYNQEITGIRELGTEYTNAEILESTAF